MTKKLPTMTLEDYERFKPEEVNMPGNGVYPLIAGCMVIIVIMMMSVLLVGCESEIMAMHRKAIEAAKDGREICYVIESPDDIRGRYCLRLEE